MENFLVVHVLQGKAYLREDVENFGRAEVVFGLGSLFDLRLEVTSIGVVHHYAEIVVLLEGVDEANDVGVSQILQGVCLLLRVASLFICSFYQRNLFDGKLLVVALALDEPGSAETACS